MSHARAAWVERPVVAALVVLAFAVALFALRLAGPNDLMDNDQERPAAYVSDLLVNDQWIVQVDITGDVTSKPPVYTWLVALGVLADGAYDRLTLYLPCGLAVLFVAWLILGVGGRVMGVRAGLLGALFYIVSMPTISMAALARTDPVFAASVAVALVLAWRAWQSGRGWTLFWLAAAISTLAKMPTMPLFAAFALMAVVWERRTGHDAPLKDHRRGSHVPGVVLYLVVCLGWLYAAYAVLGDPVLEKLLGRELAKHAITSDSGKEWPLMKFYEPPLVFVARFAPWSLLTIVALWRIIKHPSSNDTERRFERFLACFFVGGIALFAIAPHQRHVHQLPLMLAPALLAGREAVRWIAARRWSFDLVAAGLAMLLVAALIGHNAVRARDEKVIETRETLAVAQRAIARFGSLYAVTIIDAPSTMQFAAGTFQRRIAFEDAAALVKSGAPVVLAVRRIEKLDELLPAEFKPLRQLDAWPMESDERWLRLVTNADDAALAAMATRVAADDQPRVLNTRPIVARRVTLLAVLLLSLVGAAIFIGNRLARRE